MKLRNTLLIAASSLLFSGSLMAQNNLVSNGSFDEVEKKPKDLGQITLTTVWYSPDEENQADLFSKDAKKGPTAPDNDFGREVPLDGNNYAGFRAYTYKDETGRTYLQQKLAKPLIAGKTYCVSFQVSLSDLSQYAVNSIGMYISAKNTRIKDIQSFELVPQITTPGGKVMTDQYYWEEICGQFTAEGGERYITIGVFEKQDDVVAEKMKRPGEFKQPQTRDSYYFLENVGIYDIREKPDCNCSSGDEKSGQPRVIYNKNVSTDTELSLSQKVALEVVLFNENDKRVKDQYHAALNKVAALMKENAGKTLVVSGHTDSDEMFSDENDLGLKRAESVKAYLVEQGIPADSIETESKLDSNPATEDKTASGRLQNRRVSFSVK